MFAAGLLHVLAVAITFLLYLFPVLPFHPRSIHPIRVEKSYRCRAPHTACGSTRKECSGRDDMGLFDLGRKIQAPQKDVLDLLLLERTLMMTSSYLKAENKLEYVWFNKFLKDFYNHLIDPSDIFEETEASTEVRGDSKLASNGTVKLPRSSAVILTMDKLLRKMIRMDHARLSLYKESEVNPALSMTIRANISPFQVARILIQMRDVAVAELEKLLELVYVENFEASRFAELYGNEGEDIAKRSRRSIFADHALFADGNGEAVKEAFHTVNMFVTNIALEKMCCKMLEVGDQETAQYLTDFVRNIEHSKGLQSLLQNRVIGKKRGEKQLRSQDAVGKSNQDKFAGNEGWLRTRRSNTQEYLPFSLVLTAGPGTSPSSVPSFISDIYAPGSPRHLAERLLCLRFQVEREEKDRLRVQGNQIVTSSPNFPSSLHSRPSAQGKIFSSSTNASLNYSKDWRIGGNDTEIKVQSSRSGIDVQLDVYDNKTDTVAAMLNGENFFSSAVTEQVKFPSGLFTSSDGTELFFLKEGSLQATQDSELSARTSSNHEGKDAMASINSLLKRLKSIGSEFLHAREEVVSSLRDNLFQSNQSYWAQRDEYLADIKIQSRNALMLEGVIDVTDEDSVISPLQISRFNRAIYIKSPGFRLDDNSSDLYYLIEDPDYNDFSDDSRVDDSLRDEDQPTSAKLPKGTISIDELAKLLGVTYSGSEPGPKGWRVEDGSQNKAGEAGITQKLAVSLLDPPRDGAPPPPPTGIDDDHLSEEDEGERKPVDFGDMDYVDIDIFKALGPHVSIRVIGTKFEEEIDERFMALEAQPSRNFSVWGMHTAGEETVSGGGAEKLRTFVQQIFPFRRWVNYDQAVEFLYGSKFSKTDYCEEEEQTDERGSADYSEGALSDESEEWNPFLGGQVPML